MFRWLVRGKCCPARFAKKSPCRRRRGMRFSPDGNTSRAGRQLLDLDRCALILELLFDLGGFFLVDAILDGFAAGLDQILRLLEAEASDGAHLLDDVDLLVATGL